MDNPCIKQTVCKVLNRFQHGKYFVAYVLKMGLKGVGGKEFNDKLLSIYDNGT